MHKFYGDTNDDDLFLALLRILLEQISSVLVLVGKVGGSTICMIFLFVSIILYLSSKAPKQKADAHDLIIPNRLSLVLWHTQLHKDSSSSSLLQSKRGLIFVMMTRENLGESLFSLVSQDIDLAKQAATKSSIFPSKKNDMRILQHFSTKQFLIPLLVILLPILKTKYCD